MRAGQRPAAVLDVEAVDGRGRGPRTNRQRESGQYRGVPALPAGELVRWIATAQRLGHTRRALHLSDHFRYLMPAGDFTFGQYLLAHRSGGEAMAARVTVSSPAELSDRAIRGGDVVELRASDSPTRVSAQVRASIVALRRSGLEPSSVAVLASHE